MTDASEEFKSLKAMHPTAEMHTEGGKRAVLLPAFKFRAGGVDRQMDLLLFPHPHSGYKTRLFFEQSLAGCGQSANWKDRTVLARKWWAPSWQNVGEEQPWISMLGAHLRAVA